MATYHLYLDESGKFEKRYKEWQDCLIGGFLCKEELTASEAKEWLNDIRNASIEIRRERDSGFETDMATGERLHAIRQRIQKKIHSTDDIQKKREIEESRAYYIFEHCSENSARDKDDPEKRSISANERWTRQMTVLEQLEKMLWMKRPDARLVIFYTTEEHYYIDDGVTYLTVMSMGLMRLYKQLAEETAEAVTLKVHAAQRKNNVKNEQDEITPLPARKENGFRSGVMTVKQYRAQLMNCAFLHGGYGLLELPEFKNMLNSFEIIEDKNGLPNPMTVLCDYVCNSYWVSMKNDHGLREHFQQPNIANKLIFYNVFEYDKLINSDFSLETLRAKHDWGSGLIELMSRAFPDRIDMHEDGKSLTKQFFEKMNADHQYNQFKCVDAIVEYIKPFVENMENMAEWNERLDLTIRACEGKMNPEAYEALACNLLLFQETLYTHMGLRDDALRVDRAFFDHAAKVRDLEQISKLMLLFANRQIVSATDNFDYETGDRYFKHLKDYWGMYLLMGSDIVKNVAGEWGKADMFPAESQALPEFGKAMGSQVQLITHMLHTGSYGGFTMNERLKEAETLIDNMPGLFTSAKDLSRAYQNNCRLEAEMAYVQPDSRRKKDFYGKAVGSLYRAVGYETNEWNPSAAVDEQIQRILDYTGRHGERQQKIPFFFLHYVSLMNRMATDDDPDAKAFGLTLWQGITGGERYNVEACRNLCASPNPGGIAVWRLASAVAHLQAWTTDERTLLTPDKIVKLFNMAYGAFENVPATRTAMSIGILAEKAALIRQGLLPEQRIDPIIAELRERYARFLSLRNPKILDPFGPERFECLNNDSPASAFSDIVQRIAY